MYPGLVLTGFCCGLVSLAVPVFVAEVSPPHVHGLLGSGVHLAVTPDALFAFVDGKWLDWLSLTLLCTACPVLMAVSMAFAVESYRWLVTHGRRDKALDALRFRCGPKFCAEAECLTNGAISLRQPTAFRNLLQRSFSLPTGVTGDTCLPEIPESSRLVASAADGTIMSSAVQATSSLAALLLIDRAEHRCLKLVSSLIVTTSLTVLAFYCYYKNMDNGEFRDRNRYVPLASLMAYMYTYG